MKTYYIKRNPDCYTPEHNNLTITSILNFPGVTPIEIYEEFIVINTISPGTNFIEHLHENDMIQFKEV